MKIGLIGLAGAGKDTSAVILQRVLAEQGLKFEIDRYAAPLKNAAKEVFGANFDERSVKEVDVFVNQDTMIEASFRCLRRLGFTEAEHDKASELFFEHIGFLEYLSPRLYQQLLGTEVVRAVRPSAWVDRIRRLNRNIIIPDARFENEVSDCNLLITRFQNIDKPKHPSEYLAWDLQFTGKVLPVDTININNEQGTTLELLEERIRHAVSLINFNEVV